MNKTIVLIMIIVLTTGCTMNAGSENNQNINPGTSNITQPGGNTNTNNLNLENVVFNITNCKAVAYDFGGGVESWAAALNCHFDSSQDCSNGYSTITLYSPTGRTLSVKSYCAAEGDVYQSQVNYFRMDDEWITPSNGPYRFVVTFSNEIIYEKNITFNGYNVTVMPSISGGLTRDNILGGYYSYDSDYDYLELRITNSGDLPVFTDSVTATTDGDSSSITPKFISLPPNTSAELVYSWDGTLAEGTHTLVVKSFGTISSRETTLSENTLRFLVPSLSVI